MSLPDRKRSFSVTRARLLFGNDQNRYRTLRAASIKALAHGGLEEPMKRQSNDKLKRS